MMPENKFEFISVKLCLIIVAVFILQALVEVFTGWFVLNADAWFEPWRFITAIFLHGGLGHLVFNMFALFIFGSVLEKVIGGRNFLWVFLVTGILANLFSINFYPSSLGASGAIFGVIGALVVLRPGMTVWAFSMPMPMIVAGLLWAAGDIIGAVGFFTGNPLDNTGNLAHLGGMFLGIVYGFWFRTRFGSGKVYVKDNFERKVKLDERNMRVWEDYYLR